MADSIPIRENRISILCHYDKCQGVHLHGLSSYINRKAHAKRILIPRRYEYHCLKAPAHYTEWQGHAIFISNNELMRDPLGKTKNRFADRFAFLSCVLNVKIRDKLSAHKVESKLVNTTSVMSKYVCCSESSSRSNWGYPSGS